MLRILSANLNGIRSATTKGFFDWLATQAADIVCVQELKAQAADLTPAMRLPAGFAGAGFHFAQKKGYSGVALYSRQTPVRIIEGIGDAEFDAEGRYVQADFDLGENGLSVISLYVPSGSSSPERQAAKFRFMDAFWPHLQTLRQSGREIIICGDWNIAHREIDLKNWKGNLKNSGFLPEERAWMSRLLDEQGWVDVYRQLYPDTTDACYTWWSNRGQARANNVGWRIDYQIATPGIAATVRAASIYKASWFSDHAPLMMDYACLPGDVS